MIFPTNPCWNNCISLKILLHYYNLCFNGSPCYTVGCYNSVFDIVKPKLSGGSVREKILLFLWGNISHVGSLNEIYTYTKRNVISTGWSNMNLFLSLLYTNHNEVIHDTSNLVTNGMGDLYSTKTTQDNGIWNNIASFSWES